MAPYDLLSNVSWLDEENELSLRVHQLTWESDCVTSVTLTSSESQILPTWEPGSHLDLHLPNGLVRQYSLCSDPKDLRSYRIGVLREQQSTGGSAYVHDRLRPGDIVHAVGPRNQFRLVPSTDYFFIAGGIGITPILPMLAACEAAGTNWRLLYAGRALSSMAFRSELADYGDRVTIHESGTSNYPDIGAALSELSAGTHVYACGPQPLLDEVERCCATQARLHLQVEHFKPKSRDTSADVDTDIEVFCQQSGVAVTVGPTTSILEALEGAGLDVASSCREGICGTCELAVLEGTPDHRDSLLSPEEQQSGKMMMVCVSRALTPRLVLDV